MLIFLLLLFSKRVQILKTEYKYGQYWTPLNQSDCRYFFVLAISISYRTVPNTISPIFSEFPRSFESVPWKNIFKMCFCCYTILWVGSCWNWCILSLIVSIRLSLSYLHDFQLPVLLPQYIEINFFVCTNRINLLILK